MYGYPYGMPGPLVPAESFASTMATTSTRKLVRIARDLVSYDSKYHEWVDPEDSDCKVEQLKVLLICSSLHEWNSGLNDVNHIYNYFSANGAEIWQVNTSMRPHHGDRKREDIIDFIRAPGKHKLLFYNGHMLRNGSMLLGSSPEVYFHFADFVREMAAAKHAGLFSLVLDCCHAAVWCSLLNECANDQESALNQQLDWCWIAVRAGCQQDQQSYDCGVGLS